MLSQPNLTELTISDMLPHDVDSDLVRTLGNLSALLALENFKEENRIAIYCRYGGIIWGPSALHVPKIDVWTVLVWNATPCDGLKSSHANGNKASGRAGDSA